MELLLLRHANADTQADTDIQRPLSEKGFRQSEAVARFLEGYRVRPQLILSSPALRAAQTAAPIAKRLGLEVLPCAWARPGMDLEEALEELQTYSQFETLLLVGHQPDLAFLTAKLLALPDPSRLHIRKAALLHLSLRSFKSAQLEALIPCTW